MSEPDKLLEPLTSGDVRALARAISLTENGSRRADGLLKALYGKTGRATTIGVTGFPGAGKSSLVNRLIGTYREQERSVGVVAVDPSSAFSGGAILGDRIRMMSHSADEGVFIRSMATRGHLGGLSRATADVVDLVDASGRDVVLIETVGVGQDEIDVARLADTVLVVLVPGMGDDIQAIKAGILEIADIFVINKADRPGADKLVAELRHMMSLAEDRPDIPILKTVAIRGEGVDELVESVETMRAKPEMETRRADRARGRAEDRLRLLLSQRLVDAAIENGVGNDGLAELVQTVARRDVDPYTAVESMIEAAGWGKAGHEA